MPLAGVQIRKMDRDGLSAIFREFIGYGICDTQIITEFTRSVITAIRPVKEKYRCYKIKGQIDRPLDNGQADSEWIFFWAGMYDGLQIGDRVKSRISRTEVREFGDIGKARNIYPGNLVKI